MKLYLYSNESQIEIGNLVSSQLGIKKAGIYILDINEAEKVKFIAASIFAIGESEEKDIKNFFEVSSGKFLMIASVDRSGFKAEYRQAIRLVNRGMSFNEAVQRVKETNKEKRIPDYIKQMEGLK